MDSEFYFEQTKSPLKNWFYPSNGRLNRGNLLPLNFTRNYVKFVYLHGITRNCAKKIIFLMQHGLIGRNYAQLHLIKMNKNISYFA